jgi:hypothetical protein
MQHLGGVTGSRKRLWQHRRYSAPTSNFGMTGWAGIWRGIAETKHPLGGFRAGRSAAQTQPVAAQGVGPVVWQRRARRL